ncbi:MAG: Rieske (2Fe-2S) protein [Planctomycetes bacterium]|nr:Rieske (2Fe-2S) protein [Planctomycetota bacterium]
MLIVSRPDLTAAEFERLEKAIESLPYRTRWTRRAARLVMHLGGARKDAADTASIQMDAAVDYVLDDPPPDELQRMFARRDLLDVAIAATGVLAAGCVLGPLGLFLRPPEGERSPNGEHAVARADSIPVGGAVARMVDGEDMIVIRRDEDTFTVLSSTCTHSDACLVGWDPRRFQLVCPCHRGVYDVWGNVVSGPPPRPLQRHDVVVRDGEVYVTRRKA